ncbi:hypothetical protein [Streptomyces longisporoflavus]|uniref:Helix-turn-helix domain-containing protein n=1 Tax=Streptomyces longisporoflavus TaxID=28044 RepID=A0ABW7QXQ6_9ACTN
MAKTGYGKRLADDEEPHTDADFAHLHPRDADIAVFVDHLEDGAAMGYKDLAAVHPLYGQQAIRTSLRRLTEAGHLRWIKEHLTVEDSSMRWVTRTYWSRIRWSEEWWAEFARARHGQDVTHDHRSGLARAEEPTPEQEQEQEPTPEPDAAPPTENAEVPGGPGHAETPAYRALASLRDADRRMALSEGECRQLESRAAEWLERGATPQDITLALTSGLPPTVTNPGGLARTRLESKMPPKPNPKTRGRVRVTRAVMVCGLCEEPETSVKLIKGICVECRAETESCGCEQCEADAAAEARRAAPIPDTFLARPRPAADDTVADDAVVDDAVVDVTERVAELRRAAGLPVGRGGVSDRLDTEKPKDYAG